MKAKIEQKLESHSSKRD